VAALPRARSPRAGGGGHGAVAGNPVTRRAPAATAAPCRYRAAWCCRCPRHWLRRRRRYCACGPPGRRLGLGLLGFDGAAGFQAGRCAHSSQEGRVAHCRQGLDARAQSLGLLHWYRQLASAQLQCVSTTNSGFGMVKLSRTSLTFFSLLGLSWAGLDGAFAVGGAAGLTDGLATGFATGFAAGFAATGLAVLLALPGTFAAVRALLALAFLAEAVWVLGLADAFAAGLADALDLGVGVAGGLATGCAWTALVAALVAVLTLSAVAIRCSLI